MNNWFIILFILGFLLIMSGCGNQDELSDSEESEKAMDSEKSSYESEFSRAPYSECLSFVDNDREESILHPYGIHSVSVQTDKSAPLFLDYDQAVKLLDLLSEAEITANQAPSHMEAQTGDPKYIIHVYFLDCTHNYLYCVNYSHPIAFYRLTDTFSEQKDRGYVMAYNPYFEGFLSELGL